jgi:multiphosphoryl transfer protein
MNAPKNDFHNGEIAFHGTPLASGIARGNAWLLKKVDLQRLQNDKHAVKLIASELARLDFSIVRSKDQIFRFMSDSLLSVHDRSYLIFEAELRLMNDPGTVSSVKEIIERTALQVESVLAGEIARMRDAVSTCTDELTVKNLITMQDLYYRLLYNMQFSDEDRIATIMNIPDGSILVADRLTPVEVAVVPIDKVAGILIEESTRSSHASIMAQTMGIPVIIDFPGIGSLLDESTEVLIDAYNGNVFLNPTDATITKCRDTEIRQNAAKRFAGLAGDVSAGPPADASTVHSADGLAIHLLCNASNLADIVHTYTQGIKEIGLFRSEIRYLTGTVLPSAEQEAAYYTGIFGVEGIERITVRLLDMGGDKLPVYMHMEKETDPQLGCRGIRFLLSRPEVMRKQVRAILTARGKFRVQLLLPFITTVEDLTMARTILNEVVAELNLTGNPPQVGIMVEIPSVALSIERFLPKVDFISLGTNDLLQYFFAVNREQAELRKYNRFSHPAFLKLLKSVIDACGNIGRHCTICGEMASDPAGCRLLAASGATFLSVQPNAVPIVRNAIAKLNATALRTILPVLYDLDSADDVEQTIKALGIGW